MNKSKLEDRLIDFAVLVIEIINELPNSKAGNHLAGTISSMRYFSRFKLW
jgi:hypothetical protein